MEALIAWVNLSDRKVEYRTSKDYEDKCYIGGRGLATKVYWEHACAKGDPFSPDSLLVFMSGPAVATGVKAATRMTIVGRSALSGFFSFGNIGGFFPSVFRKAGFLGLVIEGTSEEPCYLYLWGGRVEIKPASHLWGKNTRETIAYLKRVHGPGTEVLTIGRAGENLVRFSTIIGPHMSSATGGLGAVMGAKKVKAIVAKKSQEYSGALSSLKMEAVKKLNSYITAVGKRIRLSIPPKIVATGKQDIVKVIGKGRCYGCDLECIRGQYRYTNRLVGYRKCQSMEYYLPWMYDKIEEPVDTVFHAPELANDYGLCTFELEHIVDWLYRCHKESVLRDEEIDLPLSDIGTWDFLERLVEVLAERKGIGDMLAEGLELAKDQFGPGAREIYDKIMKPISMHVTIPARDLDEARAHLVNVLLYQFEPRRYRPILHQGFALVAWQLHLNNPDFSPICYDVYRKICQVFWGSEEAADDSTYDGKALAAVKIQNRIYSLESLGLCTFAYPLVYSLNTENYLGDPNIEAKILATIKNIPIEEAQEMLENCGNNAVSLQRKILLREGWQLPTSDYPPKLHFIEPLPPNPIGHKVMVPRGDGKPLLPTGSVLDYVKYQVMLKEFYQLRGWSEDGIPPI